MPTDAIPLLPQCNVYLVPSSGGKDAIATFARLFRTTFEALPASVKETLEGEWLPKWARTARKEMPPPEPIEVEVCGSWAAEDDPQPFAEFDPDTMNLMFWDKAVELMPERVMAVTIAEELAHSYLWATGEAERYAADRSPEYSTDDECYETDAEEKRVRELLVEWGFAPELPQKWADENLEALKPLHPCFSRGDRPTNSEESF